MMITGMFMHKCTSMMEPVVLRQPILLTLQTIQGLNLISCSTFLTVYKQSTPTFHFTIRHMMCCIRGILQLFTFGLQSLQVWMVGGITFQQQMRLLLSFLGIMNMQLLDKTSLFNYICLHNDQNGPRYQCIWETNFNYTPLVYVLLFPHGEPGWGPGMNTSQLND